MTFLTLHPECLLLAAWLSGATLTKVTLVLGLIGLTVAFVLLSRTRWGQTGPMVKCVALAVYAHVLFLGFAYGTKMVFETPLRGRGDSILKLNLLDGGGAGGAAPESAKVWEKPAESAIEAPDLLAIAPEKKESPAEQVVESEAAAIASALSELLADRARRRKNRRSRRHPSSLTTTPPHRKKLRAHHLKWRQPHLLRRAPRTR
jgi:hypothetical protein